MRREEDRRDGPSVSRRALLAGLGLAAGGLAAGPIAGPEVAEARVAGTSVAAFGTMTNTSFDTHYWNSNRGEYMYCADGWNTNYATAGASGSVGSTSDLSLKLGPSSSYYAIDYATRRAVEYIVANAPRNDSDTRTWFSQPPASHSGDWWRARLLAQWAIWLVTMTNSHTETGYSDWNYTRVFGHSRSWMANEDGYGLDGMVASLESLLSHACSYAKGGGHDYDGLVRSFFPDGSKQPLLYRNSALTTELRIGVTAAATNEQALSDGVYRIRSAYNESYVLDSSTSSALRTQLKVWEDNGGRPQWFHLRCVSGWNLFEIRPLTNLLLTYDVANWGGAGSEVIKWMQNHDVSANQRFYLEHSDNGTWCIVPSHSTETALDLSSTPPANGTGIVTRARTRQANGYGVSSQSQRWYLERMDVSTGQVAAGTADSYDRSRAGATFGVYSDEGCTRELGRMTTGTDGWGYWNGVWDDLDEDRYVRMVFAPAGYRMDAQTYKINVWSRLVSDGGRPWLFTSLEPDTATVRFHVVDLDGTTHLVHSTELVLGTKVGPESACVADADAKAREAYPKEYEYLRKWYLDIGMGKRLTEAMVVTADLNLFARRPARLAFVWLGSDGRTWNLCHQAYRKWGMELAPGDETVTAADEALAAALDVETLDLTPRWFTDEACRTPLAATRIKANMTLRATPSWGWVSHYVDGTGNEALVRMPDGAPARFGPFAYGHRYAIDAAVTEAARAIGCTPGLASWYADATDPWVTSNQEPATPATSGSFAESVLVDRAETALYATNRLTLSFALADGSVDAAAEPELHVAADASSGAATVVLPSPVVVRRLRSRSLPGYDQAYAPTEGGRWRTLRPRAWYADAAATGTPSLTLRPSRDQTLYALWRWNTADGVVDDRG